MDLKKLLYKVLVKYYLSDNIKALFEDFVLGLQNAWAGLQPMLMPSGLSYVIMLAMCL